jgi:hypothetical protein
VSEATAITEVFGEQPALASLVTAALADLQTEEPNEQAVGTLSPLSGPLVDACRAAMAFLEWEPFFEQLAEHAGRTPIAIDTVGTLRFSEGRFWADLHPRAEADPRLLDPGDRSRARLDRLIDGYRFRPVEHDARLALETEQSGGKLLVTHFAPDRFPDFAAFLAHEGLAQQDVPEHERPAWFAGLEAVGQTAPWARALRSRIEAALVEAGNAPPHGPAFLHGGFRVSRRAGTLLPTTMRMYAAYDIGFVSARWASQTDPRDRRILKKLARRSRR